MNTKIDFAVVGKIDTTYRLDFEGEETETKLCDSFDADITFDGKKIGYVQLTVFFDEDGEQDYVYVGTIAIDDSEQHKGYGTASLKILAEKYGYVYVCPIDDYSDGLYSYLGEDISDCPPTEISSMLDFYPKMYCIR